MTSRTVLSRFAVERSASVSTRLACLTLALGALLVPAAFGQGPAQPLVWTDFPDYIPGANVYISGTGFHADEPVVLQVVHVSGNNSGNGHLPWTVTADDEGNISAMWFVDPDDSYGETFLLTADCAHGLHAQTTFTDHIKVDFRQAANNDSTSNCLPAGPIPGNVHWLNSVLQQSNSIYHEGMVVPQRLVFSEIPATANDVHTLVFWHDALKNGRHAYDFLGSWPDAVATANSIAPGQGLQYNLVNNQCGCEIGPPSGGSNGLDTICANLHVGGFTAFADCPDNMGTVGGDNVATRVAAFEIAFGNRQIKIYGNAPFTGTPTCTFTGYTGSNPAANYSLSWTSASTEIIVEFGGHLAITGPSTDPLAYSAGAGTISGAPYHFSLAHIDTTSLGNQDNQIKCTDLIPHCHIDGDFDISCGPDNTYTVTAGNGGTFDATWSLMNDTAGATIDGSASCTSVTSCSVSVDVAHCGSFTLHVSMTILGHTVVCEETVTVTDTTPPDIGCPPDTSVECGASTDPEATGTATGTDNCGEVTINYDDEPGQSNCAGTPIVRTWTATDSCGLTTTCIQTITILDTTPPSIGCPGPITVQCNSEVPDPDPSLVSRSDDCGGTVTVIHVGDAESIDPCNHVITRTYRGEDACGNAVTCTQLITVHDTTKPTITCPDPVSVQCASQVPAPDVEAVTATDNCSGPVTKTHVGDVPAGTCPTIITRTYRAEDACGNFETCTQTITVHDTISPEITCPPDINLPCGTSTDPSLTGNATATDNCTPTLPTTFTDGPLTGACTSPNGASFVRTWSATDGCNTVTCPQIITLTPPPGGACIPSSVVDLGGACGGPPPLLTSSPPIVGNYLTFRIRNAAPNAPIIMAFQGPPFPTPFALTPECILFIDVANSLIVDFWYITGDGQWTNRTFIDGGLSQLAGIQLIVQAGILAPGGPLGFVQLTNALMITFGTCPPFCSASSLGYSSSGFAGMVFDLNYSTVFPTGLDVGVFDMVGGAAAPNGLRWDATAAGQAALKTFLASPGGPSGPIGNDALNPTLPGAGGSLAVQAATLALNIAFNDANLLGSGIPGYSTQTYWNYPGLIDSLNGFTIGQILNVANQVLSGSAAPPAGYTYDDLATLVENLNLAYDGCTESFWGSKYLFHPVN